MHKKRESPGAAYLGKLLTFIRRLLGTHQLQHEMRQMQSDFYRKEDLQALIRIEITNAAQQIIHAASIQQTQEYACYRNILTLLKPMHVKGGRYVRAGKKADGGYTMFDYPDWKVIEAAYSFGINDDVSWDEDLATRGIPVFMYDHTIAQLPKQHERFNYFRMGVTGFRQDPALKTLKHILQMNGHEKSMQLILKMDVEGCEWDVFSEVDSETLNQFSQIVIELHNVTSLQDHSTIIHVLSKIHQTHQSVHVHSNNFAPPVMVADVVISPTLEILYLRRSDFEFVHSSQAPSSAALLDRPNNPLLPEVFTRLDLTLK